LPAPVPSPAKESAPTISVDDLPSVTPRSPTSAPARGVAPSVPESTASAADLFRDANAARRAGEVATSVDLYKTLIARHADSAEAHAARVSLGRLLLDKQGDAAGALVQFDSYLRSGSSDRALAEEARLGRALVFQRQGRQEEERRAWQELLERHSDSLHSARARERLRVLSGEPSP
jgi:tetratricopeptide (TPR) repeat protein